MRRLTPGALLFCLLLVSYGYFDRAAANQNSRLDLLHALTDRGTVSIDAYHDNTIDKAFDGTHYYSEKAPGIVALALPSFVVARTAVKLAGASTENPIGWQIIRWFTTAVTAGALTALGGVAAYEMLKKFLKARDAFLLATFLFLGTIVFPYATMLFSHSVVIALLTIALWTMFAARKDPWTDVLAGVCCGFAVASEFPAAIAAGGVLLYAWTLSRGRALRMAAGMVGPLLLIPAYNLATTGIPWMLPYVQNVNFAAARNTFLGFGSPSAWTFIQLLFGDYRGLLLWSPIFLLAPLGFLDVPKKLRTFLWISAAVILLTTVVMSGFPYWSGGAAVGPRYLAPMIPFLFVPVALAWKENRRIAVVLGWLSVAMMAVIVILNPLPAERALHPLWDYYPTVRVTGMNMGIVMGLPRMLSWIPLLIAQAALFKLGLQTAIKSPRKKS